ncbi:thiolase C-terminal domain-containing protein [Pseudorhodoferax sp.]|uniref:thiolase C-terminal domain-containing protein n=1 Tax=Pseudorhodoferax sp. TaxID=1993553 RepID=UPI0039E38668
MKSTAQHPPGTDTAVSRQARTLRGKAAVVGIGETTYYRHGQAPEPEFKLTLRAILAACADAGIDPREIDGFSSFHDERAAPPRLAAALGIRELRFSNLQWGGGGGGGSAAVANAAAAVATGMADCVVVFRGLAQGQFLRYGRIGATERTVSGDMAYQMPYGAMTPGQRYSMKAMRFMHEHGVRQEALRAIALASYHHAQSNPRAVMYGKPLDAATYDASRWIMEPHHLYDCCMENDGAAAIVLVSAERARQQRHPPAYVLGAAAGGPYRAAAAAANGPSYGSAHFGSVAPHLYAMAGIGPADVDVVQCYENFTGGVLMSLAEHGFFAPEEANEFLVPDNLIAGRGKLPLNTSGGNLAECYMHGMELHLEAVRQIRGQSPNQVADAEVALVAAGPMVTPVSTIVYGAQSTL